MRDTRHGFTLIEILVAITLLVVIILIMAQLFHQASVAWDGGLRQVEMSMEGRSALNLIAGELSQALADTRLPCAISPGATIQFYTSTEPDATNRTVKRVSYALVGDQLQRSESSVIAATGVPYPCPGSGLADVPVVDHVVAFRFDTPDTDGDGTGESHSTSLPGWVSIEMVLEKEAGTGQIHVWTLGLDGVDGTDDDIRTWE